ncbi:hypothetical protein C8J56DRAFT_880907 [Mycena floridula]|nr:hypothetical protein C8J56DRAFT_880907 [Mycena floridula]
MKYKGLLPVDVEGSTRNELLYNFREYKGMNFVPKLVHPKIRWNTKSPIGVEAKYEPLMWTRIMPTENEPLKMPKETVCLWRARVITKDNEVWYNDSMVNGGLVLLRRWTGITGCVFMALALIFQCPILTKTPLEDSYLPSLSGYPFNLSVIPEADQKRLEKRHQKRPETATLTPTISCC